MRGIFQTKALDDILASADGAGIGLKRTLGALDVTLLGIGAIVGAGIFATIGIAAGGDAAHAGAGPSLVLSFGITAIVCAFTALCYAEFAAMVPIAGSAYTYAYATLGELAAWIIGWDLIIEYAVGNVAVAISWANYFRTLLAGFGVTVPQWLATDYRTAADIPGLYANAPHLFGAPIVFNLLALLAVAAITAVLVLGIRESARLNAAMVLLKVLVLVFFIGVAFYFAPPSQMAANWRPFQPNGWTGTLSGAAVVFFAYIGFDAVSTVAEETRDPARDMPAGILASLVLCTLLYMAVAAVFTGLISYPDLTQKLASEQAEPLTLALQHAAPGATWASTTVAFGSVIAHTAVLLVFQLGQPRIFFAMSRDGLLPPFLSRVHPRFRTPYVATIITGVAVGSVAAFASIDEMVDLTNIGTLFAFVLVCAGVVVLRYREPERARPFRVPLGPWLLPGLGMLSCLFLMIYLPPSSWWRFFGWLVLGLAVYASYGYARSTLGRAQRRPAETPTALRIAASGFVAVAIGLFVLPQASVVAALVAGTGGAGADAVRTLVGFALIASGLLAATGGVIAHRNASVPPG